MWLTIKDTGGKLDMPRDNRIISHPANKQTRRYRKGKKDKFLFFTVHRDTSALAASVPKLAWSVVFDQMMQNGRRMQGRLKAYNDLQTCPDCE